MTDLILRLVMEQETVIGNYTFDYGTGVPQGSSLSPFLFTVAFEEALFSSDHLANVIKRGDLLAYADDILIQSSSINELKTIISEIQKLQTEWGLIINKRKSELMLAKDAEEEIAEIDGVKIVNKVKYLGMVISTDTKEIIKDAKNSIRRNVACFKGRLRYTSLEVKEQLILSYSRSLLIYFGTPLMAAGLWD